MSLLGESHQYLIIGLQFELYLVFICSYFYIFCICFAWIFLLFQDENLNYICTLLAKKWASYQILFNLWRVWSIIFAFWANKSSTERAWESPKNWKQKPLFVRFDRNKCDTLIWLAIHCMLIFFFLIWVAFLVDEKEGDMCQLLNF